MLTGDADFDLASGGTLTLRVQADGKLKEISRTAEPEVLPEENDVLFDATAIDATEGSVFRFTGAESASLAEIENGFDGQEIIIYGTDTVDVTFTVSNIAGNVSVASNAVLAAAGDYIKLTRIDGVFTEVERAIA